jgi:hypothetical protein
MEVKSKRYQIFIPIIYVHKIHTTSAMHINIIMYSRQTPSQQCSPKNANAES